MNVCIYTQSNYIRNTFINALIPQGISLFHCEHYEELIEKIISTKSEIVILDVIQEDFDAAFNLIKKIRAHEFETVKKIGVVLIIGAIGKKEITAAAELGVNGFIKSNAKESFIASYIIDVYKKITGVPPERKYVRVSIDPDSPDEKIGIKFRSPVNSQMIIGVIRDISLGGIAVELVGTFPPDSLSIGIEVKNIQFILEGKNIVVSGIVVAYREKFCAFRFTDIVEGGSEAISHFVFKKMSLLSESKEEAEKGSAGQSEVVEMKKEDKEKEG